MGKKSKPSRRKPQIKIDKGGKDYNPFRKLIICGEDLYEILYVCSFCYFIYRSPKLLRYHKKNLNTQVCANCFHSNYSAPLHTAANPLDSFTGEYNSDEEKKKATYEEVKDAVNENHVEQFMQVSPNSL